jgi:hypothetical protein
MGCSDRRRAELLGKLPDLARQSGRLPAGLQPRKSQGPQRWYFELVDSGGCRSIGTDEETLKRTIAMYMGEVLVRNAPPFEWFDPAGRPAGSCWFLRVDLTVSVAAGSRASHERPR